MKKSKKNQLVEKFIWVQAKIHCFLLNEDGDSEFNDGGSSNWLRNAAIGIAIAGIIFAWYSGLLPKFFTLIEAKISEWLS